MARVPFDIKDMKFTVEQFRAQLPLPATDRWKDGVWDLEPLVQDRVRLVFFAPQGTDYQTSHEEDEFYFIARGTGKIVIGDDSFDFTEGDAFFVAATVPHHFEQFSADFATWAVFF